MTGLRLASGLQPGAFDAQRTWQPVTGLDNQQGVLPLNLGNRDLRPERSSEIEFGVELTALDNRVGFEVVYFDQETVDALLPATTSPSLVFLQSQLTNIGALESRGVELLGNWTVLERGDVGALTTHRRRSLSAKEVHQRERGHSGESGRRGAVSLRRRRTRRGPRAAPLRA